MEKVAIADVNAHMVVASRWAEEDQIARLQLLAVDRASLMHLILGGTG